MRGKSGKEGRSPFAAETRFYESGSRVQRVESKSGEQPGMPWPVDQRLQEFNAQIIPARYQLREEFSIVVGVRSELGSRRFQRSKQENCRLVGKRMSQRHVWLYPVQAVF